MSAEGSIPRDVLVRYVLGQDLAPEQDERIEQAYFGDDGFLRQMEAVEDELVDQYVMGELEPEQREMVRRKIGESERWRRRFELAEDLKRLVLEQEASPAKAGSRVSLFRLAWAMAAAVVAVGIGYWALAPRLPGPQTAGQQANPPGRQAPPPQAVDRQTPVLTVLIGTPAVRGRAEEIPRVRLPEGRSIIELEIRLGFQPHSRYRTEIRAGARGLPQTQIEFRVDSSAAGSTLFLRVPSEELPTGRCAVIVEGSSDGGAWQAIGTYRFDVLHE